MTNLDTEKQIINELEDPGDKDIKNESAKLERDIKKGNQTKETKKDLGELRRNTFLERKGPNGKYIFYKLDAVNNYLKETSTSISKIKDALFNDRKTIVMAVQIALYKAGYLPVGRIDGQRGPITRGAVDKFQKENGLGGQKNPGYLNVKTLNKLIEVSTKKENEKEKKRKEQTKNSPKKSTNKSTNKPEEKKESEQKKKERKQIKVPTPDNKIVEEPDKTRVDKKTTNAKKEKIDLKKTVPQNKPEQKEKEKKGGTMEEVWADIVKNVGNFREWHNGDCRFAFHNDKGNIDYDLPDQITICGETYKYNDEGTDLNGLGFETYDGGRAFQLGSYNNGVLYEGFRYYFDGEKEVGKFDYVGDLIDGIRIDADGTQHEVKSYKDVN